MNDTKKKRDYNRTAQRAYRARREPLAAFDVAKTSISTVLQMCVDRDPDTVLLVPGWRLFSAILEDHLIRLEADNASK